MLCAVSQDRAPQTPQPVTEPMAVSQPSVFGASVMQSA
jgi:hypothetical protein